MDIFRAVQGDFDLIAAPGRGKPGRDGIRHQNAVGQQPEPHPVCGRFSDERRKIVAQQRFAAAKRDFHDADAPGLADYFPPFLRGELPAGETLFAAEKTAIAATLVAVAAEIERDSFRGGGTVVFLCRQIDFPAVASVRGAAPDSGVECDVSFQYIMSRCSNQQEWAEYCEKLGLFRPRPVPRRFRFFAGKGASACRGFAGARWEMFNFPDMPGSGICPLR